MTTLYTEEDFVGFLLGRVVFSAEMGMIFPTVIFVIKSKPF